MSVHLAYELFPGAIYFCQSLASRPTFKGTSFTLRSTSLAGGLGSLLGIQHFRRPIIVNIIGEDECSNEIRLKRLRSITATCRRNTV